MKDPQITEHQDACTSTVSSREAERMKLQREMEEWLAKGGVISNSAEPTKAAKERQARDLERAKRGSALGKVGKRSKL